MMCRLRFFIAAFVIVILIGQEISGIQRYIRLFLGTKSSGESLVLAMGLHHSKLEM